MTNNDKTALVLLATILTTLLALPNNEAPTGIMYAALMGKIDHGAFTGLISGMVNVGLVDRTTNHQIRLTEKGRKAAQECENVAQKARTAGVV
jgi:predicted transcriptional regulator